MNKQMRMIRPGAQGGFTLIELIVVIVILGILAATALPKFADMGGDARKAAVRAAKGSLEASMSLARGQMLVKSSDPNGTVTLDGATITMANGFPNAATIATAAGLQATDWTIVTSASSGTDKPTVPANAVAFVPISLASNTKGATCYVQYAQAASAGSSATITVDTAGC